MGCLKPLIDTVKEFKEFKELGGKLVDSFMSNRFVLNCAKSKWKRMLIIIGGYCLSH